MGIEMAEDPYKVLGVPRDAPDEEIRRIYRKLAKQLHPDLNPSNRAASEERFKKVSSAYDIVGDPVKRKQYDRGEIDANGEARRGYQRAQSGGAGPFGGRAGGTHQGEEFGFGDIFSDLFGGARAGRGETDPLRNARPRCALHAGDRLPGSRHGCQEARDHAGRRGARHHSAGGGIGWAGAAPEGQGLARRARQRARRRAGRDKGAPASAIQPSRRRYSARVPITVDEAVLGAKVEVPTISGRVQLTVPKGTSSGRIFRLKGKGVRNSGVPAPGDELVTVRIVLPEEVDEKLAYFMSEWRQSHHYDPRKVSGPAPFNLRHGHVTPPFVPEFPPNIPY